MKEKAWSSFEDWHRPAPQDRTYYSPFIEKFLKKISGDIRNDKLRRLLINCLTNTLDTTTQLKNVESGYLTYVITGDIDAMWLRDSTLQFWPYINFIPESREIRDLFLGLIHQQANFIRIDPYANAFYDSPKYGIHRTDRTDMKPGVHERKWELDSLCFHLYLVNEFCSLTNSLDILDAEELETIDLILETFRVQQRKTGVHPYLFDRDTTNPIDTLTNNGKGPKHSYTGMINSSFRPSDDACTYSYHIPSNLFALKVLTELFGNLKQIAADQLAAKCQSLLEELSDGIEKFATITVEELGEIYCYEVDGLGNFLLMDDANIPNLLSLPYLGISPKSEEIYRNTRRFVLSDRNIYFYNGELGSGVGSPHTPYRSVWPISLISEAITSTERADWDRCLKLILNSSCETGLLHESFDIDNAQIYSRPWFAWCNSFFGELILKIWKVDPEYLKSFKQDIER